MSSPCPECCERWKPELDAWKAAQAELREHWEAEARRAFAQPTPDYRAMWEELRAKVGEWERKAQDRKHGGHVVDTSSERQLAGITCPACGGTDIKDVRAFGRAFEPEVVEYGPATGTAVYRKRNRSGTIGHKDGRICRIANIEPVLKIVRGNIRAQEIKQR